MGCRDARSETVPVTTPWAYSGDIRAVSPTGAPMAITISVNSTRTGDTDVNLRKCRTMEQGGGFLGFSRTEHGRCDGSLSSYR